MAGDITEGHADILISQRQAVVTTLDKLRTAKDAICAAGLDWTIAKIPNNLDGVPDLQKTNLLVREDLWNPARLGEGSEGILGEVADDYLILQNTEAFSFFDPVVATGAISYDRAGFNKAGQHIWLTARLPEDLEVVPGDKVACFVRLGHSHGVSVRAHGVSFQFTTPSISFHPVRLLTGIPIEGYFSYLKLLSIEKPSNRIIPVARTPDGRPLLEPSAEMVLQSIQQHYEKLAEFFREMARIQMTEEQMLEFVEGVFLEPLNRGNNAAYDKAMAKRLEGIRQCSQFVRGEGPGQSQGTLWRAYNAVVEYNASWRAEQETPGAETHLKPVHVVILSMSAWSKCIQCGSKRFRLKADSLWE